MQTTSSSQIEPALRGTRYGLALEEAAKARQTRSLREAQDLAEWEAKHPECRMNRLASLQAATPRPAPANEFIGRVATQCAAALTILSDGAWHKLAGTSRHIRTRLQTEEWVEAQGKTASREFAITPLGQEWLRKYRAHHRGDRV